ncbi:MAG: TrmB family transcriptional regulator [Candidatus Hodarchaeales archaeon]
MTDNEEQIIEDLQLLGFSQNESKIIISLIKLGRPAEAKKIAKTSGVPSSKIYKILEGLEEKSIISITEIRKGANIYRLTQPPSVFIPQLQKNISEKLSAASQRSMQSLNSLYSTINDREEGFHEVWLIKGKKTIINVLKEAIENSEKYILTNMFPEFIKTLMPELISAKQRSVEIKIAMLDDEVKRISKDNQIDLLIPNSVGASFEKLDTIIKQIPYERQLKSLNSIVTNFHGLLLERPNILVVDPNTSHGTSILIINSKKRDYLLTAVQIQDAEFISFIVKLLELVLKFADSIKVFQEIFYQS